MANKSTSQTDGVKIAEQTPSPHRVIGLLEVKESLLNIMVKARGQERFRGGPEPPEAKLEGRKERMMLQVPQKAKINHLLHKLA